MFYYKEKKKRLKGWVFSVGWK